MVHSISTAYAEARGVTQRACVCPENFFIDPLQKCDVIVMGDILYDWNLDEKMVLRPKAYEVLSSRGAVIIHEILIDDVRKQNAFGLSISPNMFIEIHGVFDFTGADYQRWMKEAWLMPTQIMRLTGSGRMDVRCN